MINFGYILIGFETINQFRIILELQFYFNDFFALTGVLIGQRKSDNIIRSILALKKRVEMNDVYTRI